MYIWDLTITVRWSYTHRDDAGESEDYTVAAKTFASALDKAIKIALSKGRKFAEINDEGVEVMHLPVAVDDVIKVERGTYIDG